MGQLIVGVSLILLALLVAVGLWLEVGSGVLDPDPPMDVGSDLGLPNDGQDGNVVVTLGKGKRIFQVSRAPGDPQDWEVSGRLAPNGKPAVDDKGYLPHVVQKGETLSDLARQYFGKARLWKQILEHNRVQLMRPEDLRAGMSIRIPIWLKKSW